MAIEREGKGEGMRVTEGARRIHSPRSRWLGGRHRRTIPIWFPVADVAALVALNLALTALLLFIALAPPVPLSFPVDRQPSQVVLRDVYGLEQNSAGAYRWSKPQASVSLPLSAPGIYRVSLVMQDAPAVPTPRRVTLYLNGVASGSFIVDAAVRAYSVQSQITPATWARTNGRMLTVEWQTTAFVAPGDSRPLGLILTAVTLEPIARTAPWQPLLLVPALFLLLLVYGGVRLGGATPRQSALLLGLVMLSMALGSAFDRPQALWLAYQVLAGPLCLVAAALVLSPLPFVAPAWPWSRRVALPVASGPGETAVVPTATVAVRLWSRLSLPLVPLVFLALGLRLWRYDRLSLWLDEGYTIGFARLPWPTVLGLGKQYDIHPPLYYVLTKLVSAIVPEAHAGRLVSVVAGTLTVAVLYAVAARLANRWAASVAALAVALSPLHLWYSQEARMYALVVLCVALSYLALIAACQERAHWWVVLYGGAVLLALYSDTSALYALVPQAFLWIVCFRDNRWRAVALIGAAGLAGLLFLPWLLHNIALIGTLARHQDSYLQVTPVRVAAAALGIIGVGNGALDYWGDARTPWVVWPVLRPLFIGAVLVASFAGFVAVVRRVGITPLVIAAWSTATIGTATVISLITPGFTDKTLLCAVCGWGLFVGVAWSVGGPRWLRVGGRFALGSLILLSTLTLGTMLQTGTKQDYRGLAAAAAVAAADRLPLLTNDDALLTLIRVYQPGVLAVPHYTVSTTTVGEVVAPYSRNPGALWFAHGDYPWADSQAIAQHLVALGFERRAQQSFHGNLYLDLYARPDVLLVQREYAVQWPSGLLINAELGACPGRSLVEKNAHG